MNERTKHQGGWVATFVVVGILLVLGLLASVYFVKVRHSTINESAPASQSSSDNTSKQTEQKTKPETPPSKESTKPVTKQPSSNSDSSKPSQQPSTSQETTKPTVSKNKALPTTGPSETISSLMALGLVAFVATSYVRSRRALATDRPL